MNYKGNVLSHGQLIPGTPTSIDSPIGFIKTSETGNLEFMYFKDYVVSFKKVRFLTFQEEFRKGDRNVETVFNFHSAFLRLPSELTHLAVKKNRFVETKMDTVYRGLCLLNIHVTTENTACCNAYFSFDKHYETESGSTNLKDFKIEDYYPLNKENGITKSLLSGNSRHGCASITYIGDNKPLLFKFHQSAIENNSFLILLIGTDNNLLFAEEDYPQANRRKDKSSKKNDKFPKTIKEYIKAIDSPINSDGKVYGIKHRLPIVYSPWRFENNFGLHLLLEGKKRNGKGWIGGYWKFKSYHS